MYQVCRCQVVLFVFRNGIQLMWAFKTCEQLKLNMYKTLFKSFWCLIPNFHTKQWTGASFFLAGESNDWLDVSLKAWNHASTVCQQLIDLGESSCKSFNINYMVLIKHQTFHTCSFIFNWQVPCLYFSIWLWTFVHLLAIDISSSVYVPPNLFHNSKWLSISKGDKKLHKGKGTLKNSRTARLVLGTDKKPMLQAFHPFQVSGFASISFPTIIIFTVLPQLYERSLHNHALLETNRCIRGHSPHIKAICDVEDYDW